MTGISDERVLKLSGSEYKAPESTVPGAGGKEVWTFEALSKGKSMISMEYIRPWEQGIQPANTFSLTVLAQ